jgi:hypothetical protein
MALFEDAFKAGNIVTGLAIGIGAAVVAPVLIPALRPVAKSLIRTGLMVYEQGRVAMAEAYEKAEDMVAEVRAEMAEAVEVAAKEASTPPKD